MCSGSEQFIRCFSDKLALEACTVQFVCAGLPLALATGDGGCAIGAAARNLVERHLALIAVRQSNDGQSQVHQIGDDRKQRDFLPAMLSGCGCEGTADLAVQSAASP